MVNLSRRFGRAGFWRCAESAVLFDGYDGKLWEWTTVGVGIISEVVLVVPHG